MEAGSQRNSSELALLGGQLLGMMDDADRSEASGNGAGHIESNIRYSVIVPAYNAAHTIEPCLQALFNQSVPRDNYEVIVIDDGSTDNTAELADRYAVRLFRQSHAGPATARNLGAKLAAGKYLLFTDSDCTPTRNWIEEIVRPLEEDGKVVAAKGVYKTLQTGLIARFAQVEFEEKYAGLRRRQNIDFVDTYSAAFRRDAFWAGGAFDPTFAEASNEDTQLSFNLAAQGRRIVFAEKAIVYHRHSASLGGYLRRKWRHGFWRVRVYRQHPEKIAGDSYTPRSTQLQFIMMALMAGTFLFPTLWKYTLAAAALFVAASLPFVRRALAVGLDVAVAVPFILFLRAVALGLGLIWGVLTLPLANQSKPLAQSPKEPLREKTSCVHDG